MTQTDGDDGFDAFLAQSLAPPARMPDNHFIRRVNRQIQLDELHRRSRSRMVRRLGIELLSVVAVGCGLLAIGAGTDIADSAGNTPAAALVGMVLTFGFWVALVSRQERFKSYNSAVTVT